jgi:hypothetical protein
VVLEIHHLQAHHKVTMVEMVGQEVRAAVEVQVLLVQTLVEVQQ